MTHGIHPTSYIQYRDDQVVTVESGVIDEAMVCISLNGRELATFMCSPIDLPDLALGFLRAEGLIAGMEDVAVLHVAEPARCVDVWLVDQTIEPPSNPIITSGCGGGITFDDLSQRHPPLDSPLTLTANQVCALMQKLNLSAALYNEVRGVHTSALSDGRDLLLVAQDVGRHNTIDRLWGQALQQGIDTRDKILLASGRISSEMLNKAAKMGAPIVISRTSPTSLSVELAHAWKITVIGYARGNQFRVYTTPSRIQVKS